MTAWRKLGVIAGAGALPLAIVEACRALDRAYCVSRITGLSDPALAEEPGHDLSLGQVGARFRALKEAGVDAVVLAGVVKRPDFASLGMDAGAALLMPRVVAAARHGDDALLRVLVQAFEEKGFNVVGAQETIAGLTGPRGLLGAFAPGPSDMADLARGAEVAAAIGSLDIGQGCVVCDGLVLAVEAQEGTDAMLERVAHLPLTIRGAPGARRGVLVKRPKPIQERRIDLPTLGVRTVQLAAAAGLAGVAFEAGGALLLQRADMIALADASGLFVYGFDPQ